tara:strand:- start:259 stop:849 length:591 start_codon:yes stop_codon:yes gene_type:complete
MTKYIDNNGKFNHGRWQRDQILNEVDYSTMRLKSNIDQKWDSTDTMMDDLRQYIGAAVAASGQEMGLDLAEALKLMMNFAKGEAMTAGRNEIKVNEGTKSYEPGDKWSEDFDYIGLLKFGASAAPLTYDNIGLFNDVYESFQDVNYHREGADLGNAIEWFEDTGPGEPRVEDFMARFRKKCTETLKVMGVKWTPRR